MGVVFLSLDDLSVPLPHIGFKEELLRGQTQGSTIRIKSQRRIYQQPHVANSGVVQDEISLCGDYRINYCLT
jgi:hypothetical protein